MAAKRTRNFGTVVYPESAPEGWLEWLGEQCIPCFISPLHDSDINPDGEQKKPHYHVLLMYDGVKTQEQVEPVFEAIGGVGFEIVQSTRGYARYLCHLDNPEKFQYNPEEVKAYGGVDYHSVIGLAIDKYKAVSEMMDYVDENMITSLAQLMKYARMERMDWFRTLCDSSSYVLREYIKSNYWEMKNEDDD